MDCAGSTSSRRGGSSSTSGPILQASLRSRPRAERAEPFDQSKRRVVLISPSTRCRLYVEDPQTER